MRITYRQVNNKDYWTKRWSDIPADRPMENRNVYPLKYAEKTVQSKNGIILEAGCGAGRILRYYKDRGYDIVGIDFIEGVIKKLREIDPELHVAVGDITNLQYKDESFRYVLAFGLYHNLEHGLERAIQETFRVLERGGKLCASFRADNIQTRLTDWLEAYHSWKKEEDSGRKEFHKVNLTRGECARFFQEAGFVIEAVYTVENMPILYKFSFFRSRNHKRFDENKARAEGYQLSFLGTTLQKLLMRFSPNQFCNIYVFIAQKPGEESL